MTWVVYYSGVHGSGKTTIRTATTQRLQKAGLSVYAFPEFSYVPDIPIGTPEFQLWYRTQLRIRQELIDYLVDTKYFDIILVDRHPIDEKIYSTRIGGEERISYILENHEIHIFVFRKITEIIHSLRTRMNSEEEQYRKKWNEDDEDYLLKIDKAFGQLYEQKKLPSITGDYDNIGCIQRLINIDLNDSIDESLRIIMECIK